MAKKKLTDKQKKERAARNAKKFTVGKALDIWSIAGPAADMGLRFRDDGNMIWIKNGVPLRYSGFNIENKTFTPEMLINGYGGAGGRVIEKKIFKFLGVKGPRTQISNIGDLMDHGTYWGKTVVEVLENIDNPTVAHQQAYKTQFGIDLTKSGFDAIQYQDMLFEKILPYVAQKKIRQVLRGAGIKFPSMNLGGS